jgi:hypothetical protein
MNLLPPSWTSAMEATVFVGWIDDHLQRRAAGPKAAHPLMQEPLQPRRSPPIFSERRRKGNCSEANSR